MNKHAEDFSQLVNRERLKGEATDAIFTAMEESQLTKEAVAHKLGFSNRKINNILDRQGDFSLETLADICHILGYGIHFTLTKGNHDYQYPTVSNES